MLCLHIAWNILYVGLASGCVVSHDLKVRNRFKSNLKHLRPQDEADSSLMFPARRLSDSEGAGHVRVPRPTGRELSCHGSGGGASAAAGRIVRQHHQRARRQERPAAADAGRSHQDCALYEGEENTSSFTETCHVSVRIVSVDEDHYCCN